MHAFFKSFSDFGFLYYSSPHAFFKNFSKGPEAGIFLRSFQEFQGVFKKNIKTWICIAFPKLVYGSDSSIFQIFIF